MNQILNILKYSFYFLLIFWTLQVYYLAYIMLTTDDII